MARYISHNYSDYISRIRCISLRLILQFDFFFRFVCNYNQIYKHCGFGHGHGISTWLEQATTPHWTQLFASHDLRDGYVNMLGKSDIQRLNIILWIFLKLLWNDMLELELVNLSHVRCARYVRWDDSFRSLKMVDAISGESDAKVCACACACACVQCALMCDFVV